MFTISKQLSIVLFFILILLSLYFTTQVISNYNIDNTVYKYINYVFSSILISLIFFNSYFLKVTHNHVKINKRISLLTVLFLVMLIVFFALYIFKLINYGFLSGIILYWQISSLVIGILSIATLVYIHQKVIMKK